MPLAGDIIRASDPFKRIATTVETTDSATFTGTETVIGTVTAALVSGRTYRVRVHTRIGTTVANDIAIVRLREDNVTGTEMTSARSGAMDTSGLGNVITAEAEYTAAATANKTFVVTGIRTTGTGNLRRVAATNRPAYLYVDYVY